mmetsp:Transcript_14245/g.28591  ORF Transcript_14245/g.28591 Transcript_14245/m.28591 type:complete len:92 (+) Transcript_14245:511-786(+)
MNPTTTPIVNSMAAFGKFVDFFGGGGGAFFLKAKATVDCELAGSRRNEPVWVAPGLRTLPGALCAVPSSVTATNARRHTMDRDFIIFLTPD